MEDPISELNKQLKKSRNLDLLNFKIEDQQNYEIMNTEYKAILYINPKLHSTSDWFLDVEHAKAQCAKNMLEYLQLQPNLDPNVPVEKKPIFQRNTLLLLSVFLNVVLLVTFLPATIYILFPFLLLIFWLLTVPFFLNQDCRVLQCMGDKVVERTSISFDEYKLPIKYLNKTDYMIDKSNGVIPQKYDRSNFLAIAKQDIYLDIVQNYDSKNEDPYYKIVADCGFRVNVENGNNTAIIRIIKKDGKVLVYKSNNIGDNSVFKQQDFPLLMVRSKHGTHFIADAYTKRLDLSFTEKYQIITLIYFDWIISFFNV